MASRKKSKSQILIGLTYDLRDDYLREGFGEEETAEFDRPETINEIESALRRLGYRTRRIGNARSLIKRLSAGESWDLVFNVAEGMYGLAREAQVPAILDVYNIPYTFSDPVVLGLTLHKAFTKHVLRDAGLLTPDFFLVESEMEIREVWLPFPLFAKPVAEGTSKGIGPWSKIENRRTLARVLRDLLKRFRQPVLVETYLPGREFTVGILGSGREARALGVFEIALKPGAEEGVYSFQNKEYCETLVDYRLVRDRQARRAAVLGLQSWQVLKCRDAGRVDLREDARGRLHILEVNPLAGMHPTHSDLPMLCTAIGMPYVELISQIVKSAWTRARKEKKPDRPKK
ncbi:MAG: D-alanine--D-alanine ligase [Proteobacteria bacterium]|nr:D-alanine--D-alanine ligase [Pseudomonadota bacterium]